MEEILASIRRIIADDQSLPGRPSADDPLGPETLSEAARPAVVARHESPAAPANAPHILRTPRLEDAMGNDTADAAGSETDARLGSYGGIAPQFEQPEGPRLDPSAFAPPPETTTNDAAEDRIAITETPASEVGYGLDATASPDQGHESLDRKAAPSERIFSSTVESSVTAAFNTLAASRLVANSDELIGLTREMIRPLLKAWLDDHLPLVIEQMVSAEIERITRGGAESDVR